MLLCKTYLKPSSIQGIGLFAGEDIPKGKAIWIYQEALDITFSSNDLKNLSAPAAQQVIHYSYQCPETGNYILCGDNARFMNHASPANTHTESTGAYEGQTVASVDISLGEEITCDYLEFDMDAQRKLSGTNKS